MRLFPKMTQAGALMGLLLLALLPWQSPALAQETTGTVSGVVQDTTGAIIPQATVTLTNLDNKSERKTVSNGTGNFTLSSVSSGLQYQTEGYACRFR